MKNPNEDFPGGLVVKSPSCNAGDVGSIAGQDPTCREAAKPVHCN